MKAKPDIDQLFRTMMIIWFVLLLSQFALFGLAYSFVRPEAVANATAGFLGNESGYHNRCRCFGIH